MTTVTQTTYASTVTQTDDAHTIEVTELVLPGVGYVSSDQVDYLVVCTQAAYDALSPPDPLTLYIIRN